MLQKLDELLMQYEMADNYYEKARILRELQYLNMIVRRSLKTFIDKISSEELLKIAHDHGIEGDAETVKTVLYSRLNCHVDIFADIPSVNKRIIVTKSIMTLAKNYDVKITNDLEFISILSELINKINSYDLRIFPEFARFEALDYATRILYMSEITNEPNTNPEVVDRAKMTLNRTTTEASYASSEALLKFFKSRLSKFQLELFALLLNFNALEPDNTKNKGCFIYRIKDFNFYDSYLTILKEVPITMDDINYGLTTGTTPRSGVKR